MKEIAYGDVVSKVRIRQVADITPFFLTTRFFSPVLVELRTGVHQAAIG